MPIPEVLQPTISALTEIGFRRRRGLMFSREMGQSTLGWLGLNLASRTAGPSAVAVTPVVGLRHQQIEHMVANALNEPGHTYFPPTLTTPVRAICPPELLTDWILAGAPADASIASDIVEAVGIYGIAWQDAHADLEQLAQSLSEASKSDFQAKYRWPVALHLSGRTSEAQDAVSELAAEVAGVENLAAANLRLFLSRLEWANSRP